MPTQPSAHVTRALAIHKEKRKRQEEALQATDAMIQILEDLINQHSGDPAKSK